MKNKSFIPPTLEEKDELAEGDDEEEDIHMNEKAICQVCKKNSQCRKISLPFVLRYLTNELASMGIKLKFTVNDF